MVANARRVGSARGRPRSPSQVRTDPEVQPGRVVPALGYRRLRARVLAVAARGRWRGHQAGQRRRVGPGPAGAHRAGAARRHPAPAVRGDAAYEAAVPRMEGVGPRSAHARRQPVLAGGHHQPHLRRPLPPDAAVPRPRAPGRGGRRRDHLPRADRGRRHALLRARHARGRVDHPAVLVLLPHERLAVVVPRHQRPRGRLGEHHPVPVTGRGRRPRAAMGGVLIARCRGGRPAAARGRSLARVGGRARGGLPRGRVALALTRAGGRDRAGGPADPPGLHPLAAADLPRHHAVARRLLAGGGARRPVRRLPPRRRGGHRAGR